MKNTKYVYNGFDDFEVNKGYASCFIKEYTYNNSLAFYCLDRNKYLLPIEEKKLDKSGSCISITTLDSHPELLQPGCKLYTYPTCTIPREAMQTKYKKCLNIFTADAIVVPKNTCIESSLSRMAAVFINFDAKRIIWFSFYEWRDDHVEAYKKIKQAPLGTKLINLVVPSTTYNITKDYPNFAEAELAHVGPILEITEKDKHIYEYLTHTLPKDKFVTEAEVMNSLGDKDNAPTVESMLSIHEMLNSTDDSIIDLGLKTLATIDYAHYKESTILLLKESQWNYSKARNTTAVKFMLKTLGIRNSSRPSFVSYSDRFIYKKDYGLFVPLLKAIKKIGDTEFRRDYYNLPFVYADENWIIHPRYKTE